jgi:hypothetical protein
MSSISRKLLLRLAAQADEADICDDAKVAENLTNQIKKVAVRNDDEEYSYSKSELCSNLQEIFWDAATRIFDYYDETPDTKKVQDIIDSELECFVESVESLINKDKGEYEPKTPGEDEEEDVVAEKIFDIDSDDDDDDEKEDEYIVYDDENGDGDEDEDKTNPGKAPKSKLSDDDEDDDESDYDDENDDDK